MPAVEESDLDDLRALRDDLLSSGHAARVERDAATTAGDTAKAKAADKEMDAINDLLVTVQFAINQRVALDLDAVADELEKRIQEQRAIGLGTAADLLKNAVSKLRTHPPDDQGTGGAAGGAGGAATGGGTTTAGGGLPQASFASTVGATHWPVITSVADAKVVSRTSDGGAVGRPGRAFKASRSGGHRNHAGIDLFAAANDVVVACAEGRIVNFYPFYNASSGQMTFALIVQHPGVVINYGEVTGGSLQEFSLAIGSQVAAGQKIGRVSDTGMLHFETYAPGTTQNIRWLAGEARPAELLDPTPLLLSLAGGGTGIVTGPAGGGGGGTTPQPGLSSGARDGISKAMRLHEIGNGTPYRLYYAGKGNSGASFGFMQGDLAAGQAIAQQTFRQALARAGFAQDRIERLLGLLSVHLMSSPLHPSDEADINAALLAARDLVDAMDQEILSDVFGSVGRCISTAGAVRRTISDKALCYMALWINMSGPPTKLLTWISGADPGYAVPTPQPTGSVVDSPSVERYLQNTPYYTSNPGNWTHMRDCVAASGLTG